MPPSVYLRMLKHHARMIALLCLSAVANVVLITYLLNEKYKASTLVLITPQAGVTFARPTNEKELLDFPVAQVGVSTQTETTTKTYSELIKSRPVIERVVKTLGLDHPPEEADTSAFAAACRRAKDDVKALVANTWQMLKYGRVIETSRFDEVAGKLADQLDVEPTRNSYVFTIDLVWTDAQLAADIANETARAFVDLLTQLSQAEAQRARQFIEQRMIRGEAELARARQTLREFEGRNGNISFEEATTQKIRLIATLEGSLETTESQLSALLHEYAVTGSSAKVHSLKAQRDQLARSIAERRKELERLPDQEAQLAKLRLNVKTAEQLYELIAREDEDARLREAKKTSDIKVVAPALVPVGPMKPIKVYYAVVALLMALMVGVALAFILEVTNPRMRDIDSVQRALGVPVLATIPHVDGLRKR